MSIPSIYCKALSGDYRPNWLGLLPANEAAKEAADCILIFDTLKEPALAQINDLTLAELSKTVVATPLKHPVYRAVLSGLYVAAVVSDEIEEVRIGVAAAISGRTLKTSSPRITRQEARIVAEYLAGKNSPEIASELRVTQKTLNTHISNVLRKANVSDRGTLISLFYRSGGK